MSDAWFVNGDLLLIHQTIYGTLVDGSGSLNLIDFSNDQVSYFRDALTEDRFSIGDVEAYIDGDSFPEGQFLSESAPLTFAQWTATGGEIDDPNEHLKRSFTMFVRP